MTDRARALGIPLAGTPGPLNLITDVPGVEVGLVTLVSGDAVRTGVTAVLPRGRAGAALPCAAAIHAQNGNGELTGAHWVAETGALHTPVLLTSTHAVGPVHRGAVEWMRSRHAATTAPWVLPVVGETYDGWLHDADGPHVTAAHAVAALDAARPGAFPLGSVGGGTGMNCYGFKGGTGSASRVVRHGAAAYTVGVLLQANFGERRELTVAGVPLGAALADDDPMAAWDLAPGSGSCIAVVATDAPLLPQQCAALARRVTLGLARTGTTGSHFSGDVFLALSTGNSGALRAVAEPGEPEGDGLDHLAFVPWGRTDRFLEATVQATEEAVLDAMASSPAMTGRDAHRTPALPLERVRELVRRGTGGQVR